MFSSNCSVDYVECSFDRFTENFPRVVRKTFAQKERGEEYPQNSSLNFQKEPACTETSIDSFYLQTVVQNQYFSIMVPTPKPQTGFLRLSSQPKILQK